MICCSPGANLMRKKENEIMEDPGWIATETAVMKKKHYFENGNEESLCGKIFNTSKKVRGETINVCEDCKKILLNKNPREEPQRIKADFGVAL